MSRLLSPDEVISYLSVEVEKGGNNSKSITTLMRRVLDDGHWHEYKSTATGVVMTHGSFRDFVERGIGVRRIDLLVSWIEPVDKDVAERLRRAWREDVAPALKSAGRPVANSRATGITQESDTADSILARLKRDDPITAQAVIDGDLTANAAARIKGWRKPRILLTTPESVAKRIRDHYTQIEITELINHLRGES